MKKLMVIDGNSIINRAFYGIRPLNTKEGIPTNAIYGFLNILFKLKDEEKPDYIAVAFDMRAKTFRHKMFTDYKAQRKGMPDELAAQMPILKDVLNALNIKYIEQEGFEADDIIGTISKKCNDSNIECKIVTGDKDDLQLASKLTTVKLVVTKGGQTITNDYDYNGVVEKYGITPEEFIDLKGLMGDPSDNIPGVKGVGEVTALNLIKEFKSIENLYENLDSPNIKSAVKNKLTDQKEIAFLSKELSKIILDMDLNCDFEDLMVANYDSKALLTLFRKLEFNNLIKKLGLNEEISAGQQEFKVEIKKDFDKSLINDSIYYLINNDNVIVSLDNEIYNTDILSLKEIFENENIKKYSYDIKEQIIKLNSCNLRFEGEYYDAAIAAYVLNPSESSYDFLKLVFDYLNEEAIDLNIGASYLKRLHESMEEKLAELDLISLYKDIELPIVRVLAKMQIHGIKLDKAAIKAMDEKFSLKLKEHESRIHILAGEEFNINSPKQLGTILFEKLGLPTGKKTKTGYSTNQELLLKLQGKHDIIDEIIEYRSYSKLKSTYIDGMYSVCDNHDIIHSNFRQTVTQTGRLSSTEPNLQNIPIKLPLGRELRKVFIPVEEDDIFVSADYSQIELRVLAEITKDENLKKAFINNEDIHRQAAANIFNVPAEFVTSKMRSDAKAVNFGIIYGKSDFSLSQDLRITRKEAKQYIDNYLDKYPKVRDYMRDIVEFAKENGYVRTVLGRIRYINELKDSNYMVRQAGERIALNTPIQGTAADIMKLAMILVDKKLKENGLKSRIILQIHDEIVIETKKEEADQVKHILKSSMENAVLFDVPLVAEVTQGRTLFDLK